MNSGSSFPLAAIEVTADQSNDSLLTRIADQLVEAGIRVTGAVQSNRPQGPDCRCAMDLKILPAGPMIPISQALGKHARGCRLDTGQLENAVAFVERSLASQPQMLILNKFGNREAEGKGFAPVIGEALHAGIPVLIGLSRLNVDAMKTFCDGQFVSLEANETVILNWCDKLITQ